GNSVELPRRRSTWCWKQGPSSLSDLKEIGCKSVWLVYISPLFRPIEQLLAFKIVKIYPHPVTFSLRFFKSDRLPDGIAGQFRQFPSLRIPADLHPASIAPCGQEACRVLSAMRRDIPVIFCASGIV